MKKSLKIEQLRLYSSRMIQTYKKSIHRIKMGVVQFDIQKIEQLLNSATSERQRKMYQALLNKARSQERASINSKAPQTTPETEKKTKTETKTTKNKKKKATRQSATTEASPAIAQSITPVPKSTTQLKEEESDLPPQTKLKSLSKEPEKQQSDAETRIFQAIGAIVATPYVKDEHLKVAIDEREYDLLYVQGFRRHAYNLLREELEKNGSSPMFLRLYPQAKFNPKSQQPRLFFSLVNFSSNCEQINDEPQGFMLRGIWQYIPHCKSPVISIYRNQDQWGYFKKLSKSRQFYFVQPHHIPVVWEAPIEPFKFNPQAEKDSQMPRYFVEVRAIFKDGLYLVEEMLGEPTLELPKFIKVPKKK